MLLLCMETTSSQGYQQVGECSKTCNKNTYSTMGYKSRLIALNLLPLMMTYKINDLVFFLKCLRSPTESLNILNFITFSSSSTRSSFNSKLIYSHSNNNTSRHFFFNHLPRLWNHLPSLDLSLPFASIIMSLKSFFWSHFLQNFDPSNPCTFHMMCPCSKCLNHHSTVNFKPLCWLQFSLTDMYCNIIYLADQSSIGRPSVCPCHFLLHVCHEALNEWMNEFHWSTVWGVENTF